MIFNDKNALEYSFKNGVFNGKKKNRQIIKEKMQSALIKKENHSNQMKIISRYKNLL